MHLGVSAPQVLESEQVIRALIAQYIDERSAKEAALEQARDVERAAEAQHAEWTSDVARLQQQLAEARRQLARK